MGMETMEEYKVRHYLILPYDTIAYGNDKQEAIDRALDMCKAGLIEPNFDLAFWSEQHKIVLDTVVGITDIIELVNKTNKETANA